MIKKLAPHLLRGQYGEKQASNYLRKQGLTIVEKNYRTRRGEIDIIAKDGDVLVFVEVRLRQKTGLVSAGESLTPRKLKKWKTAAEEYLLSHYAQPPDCRFDAILIAQDKSSESLEWVKGLFL